MTAVTLYDVLARAQPARADTGGDGGGSDLPLVWVAERMVAAALADLERVREYEQRCLTQDWRDAGLHRSLTESIYALFRQWSADAEQVLDRVNRLTAGGPVVAGARDLEDACWRVRARLKLTPDHIERATDQVRRGETIPATRIRDELRARLRA